MGKKISAFYACEAGENMIISPYLGVKLVGLVHPHWKLDSMVLYYLGFLQITVEKFLELFVINVVEMALILVNSL